MPTPQEALAGLTKYLSHREECYDYPDWVIDHRFPNACKCGLNQIKNQLRAIGTPIHANTNGGGTLVLPISGTDVPWKVIKVTVSVTYNNLINVYILDIIDQQSPQISLATCLTEQHNKIDFDQITLSLDTYVEVNLDFSSLLASDQLEIEVGNLSLM